MMRWIRMHYAIAVVVASALVAITSFSILVSVGMSFDRTFKIGDLALCVTLSLFVVTLIQLYRNQRVQQATAAKEFLSEFRKDADLYAAYFDLVYSYQDSLFEKVKSEVANKLTIALERQADMSAWQAEFLACRAKLTVPDFDFGDVQADRKSGMRLYWPGLFSFSDEERRLDTLLDYFNTVGFYYDEGLIDIADVTRVLGDYIYGLQRRKIVSEYLRYCQSSTTQTVRERVPEPYLYLSLLLHEFDLYLTTAEAKRLLASARKRRQSF